MNTPLDSRQIRAFCTLARTGSFTATGRELHLTSSSVSHSMKTLEGDVGCRLLDRTGKTVTLTQAGEQLLHHATKILGEMEMARAALKHLGRWGRGRLRLGASTTACQHLIPPVLRTFKEQYPEHAITLEPGDTPALVESLLRQRIDLALTLDPGHEPQLDFHRLFTDQLQFLVGASHPWAQTRRVEQSEIPRQSYILYSKHSVTFRLVEDYFRREGTSLKTVIELGSMEATKELVKLGLGVSILAPWIARKEIEENSLVPLPLGRRKLQRRWGILRRRGKRLDLAEETFIDLCESATAPLRNAEDGRNGQG
jgi:LysR family transcriptional regulator, low CO2-responsive transcriptional regulator